MFRAEIEYDLRRRAVRLGNSDLNVSRIILGTMQYGNSRWQPWVLEEEEALKHITRAYLLCVVCARA